jgi:hypothetical protein
MNTNTQTQNESTPEVKFENQKSENNAFRSDNMRNDHHNPILDFVINLGETAKHLWNVYAVWIIDVSWGKLFLACLLILITGGLIGLHSLANFLVLGSLLLKCFIGKEEHKTDVKEAPLFTDEEKNRE